MPPAPLTPMAPAEGLNISGERIFATNLLFNDIAWSPDGTRVVVSGYDGVSGGYLQVINVLNGEIEFEEHFINSMLRVDWSARNVIAAMDNQREEIQLWSGDDYRKLDPVTGTFILSFKFSHSGNLLAIGGGKGLSVWDIDIKQFEYSSDDLEQLNEFEVQDLDWSPDDDEIVVANLDAFHILALSSKSFTQVLPSDQWDTFFVDWSSNSPLIAISSVTGHLMVFSRDTLTIVGEAEHMVLYEPELSSNGEILAGIDSDTAGVVYLLDIDSMKTVATLQRHGVRLAWSPNGERLAVATFASNFAEDQTTYIYVWHLDAQP